MKNWINEEFKDLSLGDKRLTDRFLKTMKTFDMRPDGCINRIFKDEAAARRAAYRLFSNDKFTTEKVFDCHKEMTAERMKPHKVVLSLHDSSFFSYNTKPSIEGLGNIGGSLGDGEETKGFIGHYALGITEAGLPLGLQAMKTWSRAYESEWDKESERWVELLEDALKVVNYYRLRWQVENYFKVLKDGCCYVEHANLRNFERLDKYTACFSIIAWRLFWMKFLYHTDPELPAKAVLTDLEIEVLRVRYQGLKKEKLTVREALKLIAMFGGYNNRKGDGPPGNVTLWRGFMIIRDRAEYHEELVIAKKIPYPMDSEE